MNSEGPQSRIEQIMRQAVAEQTRRFTYCLITGKGEDARIGTGVAIRLGSRFFLITAAHVVGKRTSIKALVRDQVAICASDFVAKHCDNRHDVGLLEISPSDAERLEFLPLDRLCETIDSSGEVPAMVVGFPRQLCQDSGPTDLTPENSLRLVICNTLSFYTVVLPRSKWPNDGLEDERGECKPLVDGVDMLMDYAPEPEIRPVTPKTSGTVNPPIECRSLDPCGMSGGGIWLAQIGESEEGVNYPDTRLIGLQTSWYHQRNLLRGIRIGAWLDVIRDQYSDLKDLL